VANFVLFWKDGNVTTIDGASFANALVKNGHKLSDVPQIQCYIENGSVTDMNYLPEVGQWVKQKEKGMV
jgi:hypothetical protein